MTFKLTFVDNFHADVPILSVPLRVGRNPDNDIVLPLPTISGSHAEIIKDADRIVLVDLDSTNGTMVNDVRLRGQMEIKPGDRIEFDRVVAELEQVVDDVSSVEPQTKEPEPETDYLQIEQRKVPLVGTRATVGRMPGSDVLVNNQTVSSRHAVFFRSGGNWWIEDSGSTNGTFVNEQRIERKLLADGDLLRLGDQEILFVAMEPVIVTSAPSVLIRISEE